MSRINRALQLNAWGACIKIFTWQLIHADGSRQRKYTTWREIDEERRAKLIKKCYRAKVQPWEMWKSKWSKNGSWIKNEAVRYGWLCVSGWFSPNKYHLLYCFVCCIIKLVILCGYVHFPTPLGHFVVVPSALIFKPVINGIGLTVVTIVLITRYSEYGIFVWSISKVVSVFILCHLPCLYFAPVAPTRSLLHVCCNTSMGGHGWYRRRASIKSDPLANSFLCTTSHPWCSVLWSDHKLRPLWCECFGP